MRPTTEKQTMMQGLYQVERFRVRRGLVGKMSFCRKTLFYSSHYNDGTLRSMYVVRRALSPGTGEWKVRFVYRCMHSVVAVG